MSHFLFTVGGFGGGGKVEVRRIPMRRERITFTVPLLRAARTPWRPADPLNPPPMFALWTIAAEAFAAARKGRHQRTAARACIRHLRRMLAARKARQLALADVEALLAREAWRSATGHEFDVYAAGKVLADQRQRINGRKAVAKRYGMSPNAQADRNRRILAALAEGATQAEVAADYGLTERQIRKIAAAAKRN